MTVLLVALSAVSAAIVGCPAQEAKAACVATLTWRGATYVGTAPQPKNLTVGRRLATKGRIPPCIDTVPPPNPRPKAQSVAVSRYVGVPPQLALHTRSYGLRVAAGFFPELPSHPLHIALYGERPGVPDATRKARCSGSRRLRGVVTDTRFGLDVDPAGRRRHLDVVVDALSSIEGFERFGTPHLERGDRIAVSGISCRYPKTDPPGFLAARRILPADS